MVNGTKRFPVLESRLNQFTGLSKQKDRFSEVVNVFVKSLSKFQFFADFLLILKIFSSFYPYIIYIFTFLLRPFGLFHVPSLPCGETCISTDTCKGNIILYFHTAKSQAE